MALHLRALVNDVGIDAKYVSVIGILDHPHRSEFGLSWEFLFGLGNIFGGGL